MAPGMDGKSVSTAQKALTEAEAVVRLVWPRLAAIETAERDTVEPDGTLETMPSVLFDAVVVPDGAKAATALAALGHAREFLRDQYRHCRAILLSGAGEQLATAAGLPTDDRADWAIARDLRAFIGAVGKHRNWNRATDPPRLKNAPRPDARPAPARARRRLGTLRRGWDERGSPCAFHRRLGRGDRHVLAPPSPEDPGAGSVACGGQLALSR